MKRLFLFFICFYGIFLFAQNNPVSDAPNSATPNKSPVVLKLPKEATLISKDYYDQLGALNNLSTSLKVQSDPGSSDVISQQFETANSIKTTNVADDFTVPDTKIWSIESVSAVGNLIGSVQPTVFNVTFYTNSGTNLPETVVRTETIVLSTGATNPTLPLATPLVLTSGTYWVSVQAVLNSATQGSWYWKTYNAFDTFGSPFAIKNPGNGYGFPCLVNWTYYATCIGAKYKDLQFTLTGTESGLPCKTITDKLSSADLTNVGRITRTLPVSVCGTSKTFPGYFTTTGNFHYKTYSVKNTSAASQCITFNLTNQDANFIHLTAYNTTFNPADLSENYMGDIANSSGLNATQTMGITVPANTTVILVASETVVNSTFTLDYKIDIFSDDCGTVLQTSQSNKNNVNLYPNPTKRILFVSGVNLKLAKIYDASGKLVSTKNKGNEINVENLPKGTYLIQFEDKDGKLHSDKFIKN